MKTNPGLRLPGSWDSFELTVRAVLGQQISVKGATTLAGRRARLYGKPFSPANGLTHLFPTAEALAKADLAQVGLTKARAQTIQSLAKAVTRGEIRFDGVFDTADFISRITELPGIGNWTAQYIAMRALADPDAFPSGDIALIRALAVESAAELDKRAEAWRPWRAYAAIYLWRISGQKQLGLPNVETAGGRQVQRNSLISSFNSESQLSRRA
jgi:AraC family transcriptional regulator of adaptative response / DNA-3-methyladenine glycosylase II